MAEIFDDVCNILQTRRKPLTARELVHELATRGITIDKSRLNQLLWNESSRPPGLSVDRDFRWTFHDEDALEASRPAPLSVDAHSGGRAASQERFLQLLKERELANITLSIEEAAAGTGLSESSVRTYISKKLLDRFVYRDETTGRFRARGCLRLTLDQFAAVMTQKSAPADSNADAWMTQLNELIATGSAAGIDVPRLLRETLARLDAGD